MGVATSCTVSKALLNTKYTPIAYRTFLGYRAHFTIVAVPSHISRRSRRGVSHFGTVGRSLVWARWKRLMQRERRSLSHTYWAQGIGISW